MRRTLFRVGMRLLVRPVLTPASPLRLQRFWIRLLSSSLPLARGMRCTRVQMSHVEAIRIDHDAPRSPLSSARCILYLHGGGFCLGSPDMCRGLLSHLGHRAGAVTYAPRYRLAPEHPFPAALEDALTAYRWLLDGGATSTTIALAGDSAGAGLALAAVIAARDARLPMPGAMILLSPWTDLTLSGESISVNAPRDIVLAPSYLRRCAEAYCGGLPRDHPAVSPLFARLIDLPPTLVLVGSHEILLSDSERLVHRLRAAGVITDLQQHAGMWHDYYLHAGLLPESTEATRHMAVFLRQYLRPSPVVTAPAGTPPAARS